MNGSTLALGLVGALAFASTRRGARQVVPPEVIQEAKEASRRFREDFPSWREDFETESVFSAFWGRLDKLFKSRNVLGGGTQRVVLASRDLRYVIKLTHEPKYNLYEAAAWRDAGSETRKLLVPVIAVDPEGHWLIMERVTPTSWCEDEDPYPPGVEDLKRKFEALGFMDWQDHNTSEDVRVYDYAENVSLKGSPARRASPPLELPSVFYHGAPRADLRTLKPSSSGALGPGIYLATESREAFRWAQLRAQVGHVPTVFRVRVEINRPYLWRPEDGAQHPDLVNARVRRQGYDAIVRRTMDDSIPELIVFSADQVVWMAKS